MSPTSYRTAPPRVNTLHYREITRTVNGPPCKRGGSVRRWQHLKAKVLARFAHAVVQAEDGQFGDRRTSDQGAGQVQGVERPEGLAGERAPGAFEDLFVELEEVPVSARYRQHTPAIGDLSLP